MVVPTILFWSHSVPYLVGISVYSIIAGHWSSEESAKVEVKMEEAEEEDKGGGESGSTSEVV